MENIISIILKKEVIQITLIIIISVFAYMVINNIFKRILRVNIKQFDIKKKKTMLTMAKSVLRYVVIVIDILLILSVFGVDTKAIIASLGVMGAVLGLAFQDLLKDVIAGASILMENQYSVGDTVEINGFKGEVLSLGLKTTSLKAYTGEIKILSNRVVTEVINYSLDMNMAIVDVPVAHDSDLNKIEKILNKVCMEQQDILPNLKGTIELLGVHRFDDSGLVYRIVVPCVPMLHFGVERALRKAVKEAFVKNKIANPYSQVVIHNDGV